MNHRGFTLIELLVVLAILGFAAAIAVPRLAGGTSGARLKSATQDLATALRSARSQAIASNRSVALTLDLQNRQFRIGEDGLVMPLPTSLLLKFVTARSESVAPDSGRIRFFPDGTATGGRVTLTSGRRQAEIDVGWLTGRVMVTEP